MSESIQQLFASAKIHDMQRNDMYACCHLKCCRIKLFINWSCWIILNCVHNFTFVANVSGRVNHISMDLQILIRFVRQIPDCTHLSRISMVLFSFHQNEKIRFLPKIFCQFWTKFFPWYWIPWNSLVFNTVGKIWTKNDTNHSANLIFSFWWNENNTVEIPDGWVQSGIWCTNLW